jgi:DNA photolyase
VRTLIHWFRRDLRITDNVGLYTAWYRSEALVPVFVLDDAIIHSPGTAPVRVRFLLAALESLQQNLAALGHQLLILHGRPWPGAPVPRRSTPTGITAPARWRETGGWRPPSTPSTWALNPARTR